MSVRRDLFGRETGWLRFLPAERIRRRLDHLARHRFAVPLGPDTLLTQVLGPNKMYVDPQDRGITPHLLADGYWEPRTTEVIVDRLRPGMVAIDAGANLGYFTLLMALLVGGQGHVHAFEPVPLTGDRLGQTMFVNGLDGRVTLHRDPLGEEDGRAVRLIVEPHQRGGAHISAADVAGFDAIMARTRRLDGVPGARDAALVKIDTEGAEEAVWRGMAGLIAGRALRWVVVEFTPIAYADPAGLLDEATAAGFRLLRIDDVRGAVPVTRDAILAGAPQQMLLLER